MILSRAIAALLAIAPAFAAGSLSACHESAAAPVATEVVDPSGERIELTQAQALTFGTVASRAHYVKSLLNVPGRINYGDYVWNESGVPAGRIWILVDLAAQTLSVFRGEHEIGTTVLLYGSDKTPTPLGRFTVLAKSKDHRSSSYNNAPMPYTLRLTGDGVSIHGSFVQPRAGTHGCLGVPVEFAKRLFAEARIGDEVLIIRDTSSGKASA